MDYRNHLGTSLPHQSFSSTLPPIREKVHTIEPTDRPFPSSLKKLVCYKLSALYDAGRIDAGSRNVLRRIAPVRYGCGAIIAHVHHTSSADRTGIG
ncbi:hypothetical protein ZHAS_00021422 [Anopheles sinensis]|uniref:Uncharacterized protein n=1 Tax=Anopheles sinensis TaxID=74873 RepID=A0A084WSD4_ANOSI|nr:hypothetical protein ZHAS_00021422 [Anopheles sinensis]